MLVKRWRTLDKGVVCLAFTKPSHARWYSVHVCKVLTWYRNARRSYRAIRMAYMGGEVVQVQRASVLAVPRCRKAYR